MVVCPFWSPPPVTQPSQRAARRSAGNTNDLRGKILRISVQEDGSYTIPEGNLFAPGTADTRAEIFAMGLRNPFRMVFDPLDGTMWIGNVGGNNSDSFEEIDRGVAGANYGWPDQEGPECFVSNCAGYDFPEFF